MKTINAMEFEAECLSLLDEVSSTGESITILKRGRPVARLVGIVERKPDRTPQESLEGTVEFLGDIVKPAVPGDAWEAECS